MSIKHHWDNEAQTVIRMVIEGVWNWKDFHKNLRIMGFRLNNLDHPVELVIDLRGSQKLPAGAFGHIRSLGKQIHPNGRDRVLIIGLDEALARQIGGEDGLYEDAGRLIRFVPTEEAAQAVLKAWLV